MKNNLLQFIIIIFVAIIIQGCGSYKTFTGMVKYEAPKNNQVIKSIEFKSYLESRDKIKFVLRSPEGFTTFPEDEQKRLNEAFSQIEKELILNGHIVKDRFLLELLLDKGDMSLKEVGKAIDTDIIIEIIDIDFNIPNRVKNFSIKEKGINTNFDNWNNIDYIDCRLSMLKCRVTLVEVGNVGGILELYISGCDKGSDFYINAYEQYSGLLDNTKEATVGWNYGNVTFKSLTHTYDMNIMSRQKAIERLVKALLAELRITS
jgi:hypothetical protein